MNRRPYLTLVALMILAATFILTTLDQLPGTVATNFGADNLANGWMTRGGYCWFILGFALALPLVVFGIIGWLSGAMPNRVNIPNRAYWLASACLSSSWPASPSGSGNCTGASVNLADVASSLTKLFARGRENPIKANHD